MNESIWLILLSRSNFNNLFQKIVSKNPSFYELTYLLICEEIWATKEILSRWCKVTSIFIYKKGDTNDPSNFTLITLEPVALKILTSLIRDRIYYFLASDSDIESEI